MLNLKMAIRALISVGICWASESPASDDIQEGHTSSFSGKSIGDQTTVNDSTSTLHRNLFLESSEDESEEDSQGEMDFSDYYKQEEEAQEAHNISDSDKENKNPEVPSLKERKRKREEENEPKESKKKLQRTQSFYFKADQGTLTYRGKKIAVSLSAETFFKTLGKYSAPFQPYEGLEELKEIPKAKIGDANDCYKKYKNSYEEELTILSHLLSHAYETEQKEFLENHKKALLESWICLEDFYCSNRTTYVPVDFGQDHKEFQLILLNLAIVCNTPSWRNFQTIKGDCARELEKLQETLTPLDIRYLEPGHCRCESFFMGGKDITRAYLNRKIGHLQKVQEIFFSPGKGSSAEEIFSGLIQIWDDLKTPQNSQNTSTTTTTTTSTS